MKANLTLELTVPRDYQDDWMALHKLDPTPENVHKMILAICEYIEDGHTSLHEELDWRIVRPSAGFPREYSDTPTLESSP